METIICYRIAREKYANSLFASGVANRWNKDQEWVLYASSSRALATLELLVHRSYIRPDFKYRIMVLEISFSDGDDALESFTVSDLPDQWRSITAYPDLQKLGSTWYQRQSSLVLEVPSVIIPQEKNFVIHSHHADYGRQVSLLDTESFFWDERLL